MSATNQTVEADLATITESRSTNTAGYRIVIHNDGSALLEVDGRLGVPPRSQDFPAGTVDTKTLGSLLAQIGDVSKIPTGVCPKSVSCGTTTEISYAGKTSGDLQSIPKYASAADPAMQQADGELLEFVQNTERRLMANTGPQPAVKPALASIWGSTTTVRYNVAIHNDGSATATIAGIAFDLVRNQQLPPGTIDTKKLLRLLTEIGDVSRIPAEPCPNPIPAGKTGTAISYKGKTSGDLQNIQTSCADQALLHASAKLAGFVQEVLKKLDI